MNNLKFLALFLVATVTTNASADTSPQDPSFQLKTSLSELEAYEQPATNHQFYATERSKFAVTLFDPNNPADGDRLWSQTKLTFGLAVGAMGVIYLMPESWSNWDKDEVGSGNLMSNWWDNVSSGPVWDEDRWVINYIGHPYFGGVYYQTARNSGYDQWDSFIYSALMSTFYWEYGLEAFAEIPSIQDLIVTPVGGWIYGEWAHHKQKEIEARDGLVWGSKRWGNVALFFLDPVDNIGKGVNGLFGRDVVKTGTVRISPYPQHFQPVAHQEVKGYIGLDIELRF